MRTINPMIPVFIASPRDVSRERRVAETAIHTLAPRFARLFGITLVPLLWEEFAPVSSYDDTHPQVGILKRIQPFSIFIGILWNRHGTKVGNSSETGTEMEFIHAMQHRATISILSYFRAPSPTNGMTKEEMDQQRKVARLRKKLHRANISTVSYKDVNAFAKRITPDIMEACLELVVSREPKKISNLYKFFKRGSHWRVGSRPLLIVYPPITDPGPGHAKPTMDWQKRLLPHVIYEDFKALQDIEESMRLLGREYKTVTTDSPSLNMADPGDRVWICVPRNVKAQRVLEELKKNGRDVRFEFFSENAGDGPETCLKWTNNSGTFTIRSPLSKYLNFSARPKGEAEWKPAFGHSYCRDYALLARLKVGRDPEDSGSEYYYHYFIGGIRGLGTWGVGYLIDHESSLLVRMMKEKLSTKEDEDIQLLLEVTFENFRITRVRDVSSQNAKYFEERCSNDYILGQLSRHPDWAPQLPMIKVEIGNCAYAGEQDVDAKAER